MLQAIASGDMWIQVLCTQIGEMVDAKNLSMGAWFEAQVVKVTIETSLTTAEDSPTSSSEAEPTIFYHVKFDE